MSDEVNGTLSKLSLIPAMEDDGRIVTCRALTPLLAGGFVEDEWRMQVFCKYIQWWRRRSFSQWRRRWQYEYGNPPRRRRLASAGEKRLFSLGTEPNGKKETWRKRFHQLSSLPPHRMAFPEYAPLSYNSSIRLQTCVYKKVKYGGKILAFLYWKRTIEATAGPIIIHLLTQMYFFRPLDLFNCWDVAFLHSFLAFCVQSSQLATAFYCYSQVTP